MAKGPGLSGGGDGQIIVAAPYPQQATLRQAIQILKSKITNSAYSGELKQAYLSELDDLSAGNKILYVPVSVSLGNQRYNGDYRDLNSVGAFTQFEKGAPIFLTSQTLGYSATKLAQVIAQELPHHLLGKGIDDESIVNPIGNSFMTGQRVAEAELLLNRRDQGPEQMIESLRSYMASFGCAISPSLKSTRDFGSMPEWRSALGIMVSDSDAMFSDDNTFAAKRAQALKCRTRFWAYEKATGTVGAAIDLFATSLEDLESQDTSLKLHEGRKLAEAKCGDLRRDASETSAFSVIEHEIRYVNQRRESIYEADAQTRLNLAASAMRLGSPLKFYIADWQEKSFYGDTFRRSSAIGIYPASRISAQPLSCARVLACAGRADTQPKEFIYAEDGIAFFTRQVMQASETYIKNDARDSKVFNPRCMTQPNNEVNASGAWMSLLGRKAR